MLQTKGLTGLLTVSNGVLIPEEGTKKNPPLVLVFVVKLTL